MRRVPNKRCNIGLSQIPISPYRANVTNSHSEATSVLAVDFILYVWRNVEYWMCKFRRKKYFSPRFSLLWLYFFLYENLLQYLRIKFLHVLSYIMVIRKTNLSYSLKQKHQYLEYFWHQLAPLSPLKTHKIFFVNFWFLSDELSPTGKPNTSIKTLAYQ